MLDLGRFLFLIIVIVVVIVIVIGIAIIIVIVIVVIAIAIVLFLLLYPPTTAGFYLASLVALLPFLRRYKIFDFP